MDLCYLYLKTIFFILKKVVKVFKGNLNMKEKEQSKESNKQQNNYNNNKKEFYRT